MPRPAPAPGALFGRVAKFLGSSVEIAGGIVIVIVLAAFFAHDPRTYRDAVRMLVPRSAEEVYDATWEKLQIGLRHWVRGILVSMTIMGIVAAVGLKIAGIQSWAVLGALVFLGTFVPYVGAIASSIPGLLLGLAHSGSQFLAALCVYLGVHIIEGYLVQPFVMRRAVIIQPAFLLIWQLVMGTLCGLLGIIVATPLLVCVQIVVGEVYVRRKLGKSPHVIGENAAA
jgi:predicted PurR-regulated permease PerM